MADEDREASPEPSSSHLCENSIDGYLSGEGPSASGVIDSSQLFADTFEEGESFVESQSKSLNSSEYELMPFGRTYSYSEAAMSCQVGQSNFCERSDLYTGPSHSKQNDNDFHSMEIDDNQPASSSGSFPSHCERQEFQNENSNFEPNSNENESEIHYKLEYQYPINFNKSKDDNSVSLNASSSKPADSSLFGKNKGFGKKFPKGKGKGKGKSSSRHGFHSKFASARTSKSRENKVESSNKASLFANHSSDHRNSLLQRTHRTNESGSIDNEDNEIDDSVNTSSRNDFLNQRQIRTLSEDEAYMVASSSEGVNRMRQILEISSPTTPGDNCLVSSSTGQLDSLPPTPINFQGNDASHSSPASSPLNPPVLDSTVDSTSGQNLLSSYCDDEDNENEGVRSDNDLEFSCSLDEGRNEISTSVSHLQHGVDSQELNLLVGTHGVFGEQQPNDAPHFVNQFISLDNLHSSSLHSTLADEKSNDESVSALVPSSSAYLPDSLEMPGSSHMSESSKRLLYRRRKETNYSSSLDTNNSSLPINNINAISFSEESALAPCNSEGALSHVGLIELGISEMEPESSSLVASSANLDNEEYPATSESALSPSENNLESSSTLAQLNQHFLLGIGENSLSSEGGLSPESVSPAEPELNEASLELNEQLRAKEDSLGSASDNEGASNLHASLELGLGPQQLRRLTGSQQEPEPQSLVPPPHLLEEANNTDSSSNIGILECSSPLVGSVQDSNAGLIRNNLNKSNQVVPSMKSENSPGTCKNKFILTVSEAEALPPTRFNSYSSGALSARDRSKTSARRFSDNEIEASQLPKHSYHLNMDSSSYESSISEKENIYRIPNGVLRCGNADSFGKLHPSECPILSSDEEGDGEVDSASNVSQSNEISLQKNSVPINMHSLFGQRPILKPSPSKSLISYPINHVAKEGSHFPSADPNKKDGNNERRSRHQNHDLEPKAACQSYPSWGKKSSKSSMKSSPNQESFTPQNFPSGSEQKRNEECIVEEESSPKKFASSSKLCEVNEECHSSNVPTISESEKSASSPSDSIREGNGFWCADCEKLLETKCSLHRIQTIMDKPVLTRAWASLPAQHLAIKIVPTENADCKELCNGVFTRKTIPKRTQFGPLEGVFVKELPPLFGLLFKTTQNSAEGFIDISEEGSSNWMRFVRAANTFTQMNCVVIEEENFIYFLTTANLPSKTELRVGYSKQYAVKYNLPLLVPTEEEKDLLQKSLTCSFCKVKFSSASELEDHLSSHCKGGSYERRPKRRVRPKGFKQTSPQPPRLVKRVKVNKRTSAGVDGTEASSETAKKDDDEKNVFECIHCELCFHQHEVLRLHLLGHPPLPHNAQAEESELNSCEEGSSKRPTPEMKRCPSCSNNYTSFQELIEHVKDHSFLFAKASNEQRTFKCELCYKSFSSVERLLSHSESHKSDNEKPFSCYHCFRRFCNKSALGSHSKLHFENDGAKMYDCPICQDKFASIATLKTHLPVHCDNGEYTCPTCSKKFSTYHKIRRHIRSYHSASHPCLQCGKSLPSLQKLKVHLVSHSDRRDFACPVCQKCFKRKDKMKEHLKRIHTVKREPNNNNNHATYSNRKKNTKFVPKVDPSDYKQFLYKCDSCLLGFKRRGMLVNHLSKRHPNIPISSIPELNQPILRTSHSYFCQYCGKAYVSSSKRKLHILKNHPGAEVPPSCASVGEEGAKTTRTFPASCPWCPRQYATNAKLLQHQRYHHGLNKDQAADPDAKTLSEPPKPDGPEEEPEKPSQEDILSQALGRISGKAQFVRVDSEGGPSVVELRVQHEDQQQEEEEAEERRVAKQTAPVGDQVLVSPSFLLPHEGTSYALLTPDGADSFTLSLRPGQILPAVGSFSVLSTPDAPSTSEASNPGPSSRLLPIDSVPHPQFALELNGMKGDSCVVAQVGAEAPSPVLVWQPSLSFTPSS